MQVDGVTQVAWIVNKLSTPPAIVGSGWQSAGGRGCTRVGGRPHVKCVLILTRDVTEAVESEKSFGAKGKICTRVVSLLTSLNDALWIHLKDEIADIEPRDFGAMLSTQKRISLGEKTTALDVERRGEFYGCRVPEVVTSNGGNIVSSFILQTSALGSYLKIGNDGEGYLGSSNDSRAIERARHASCLAPTVDDGRVRDGGYGRSSCRCRIGSAFQQTSIDERSPFGVRLIGGNE